MKKLLFPLLAILFLISCGKESTTELQSEFEQNISENVSATARSSNKRNVCHNGNIINVNINAISDHRGHGDAVDMDEDGFFDSECDCGTLVDCDDTNPAINPEADEVCDDGIDNNCNGQIDENCACVEGELDVLIDPDGTPGTGDEYTIYVYPGDNSSGIRWLNSFTSTGATDDWDGATNTQDIVMIGGAGTSYAAGLCASLTDGGCDWYLPARNELNAMYQKLGANGTGEMPDGAYWSSNEVDEFNAWFQLFSQDDAFFYDNKSAINRCRCVRR